MLFVVDFSLVVEFEGDVAAAAVVVVVGVVVVVVVAVADEAATDVVGIFVVGESFILFFSFSKQNKNKD